MSEFSRRSPRRYKPTAFARRAHSKAARAQLSRGIVTRLTRGGLPDPEFLVPLVRIERVSLSWLLTGEGARYSVLTATDDVEAWHEIKERLADEPEAWHIDLAVSDAGWTVVLHQDCTSTTKGGELYSYRATEVIAGRVCGPVVARGIQQWARLKQMHGLRLSTKDWLRLVSGQLGNAQLWGAQGVKPAAQREPIEDLADWLPDYSLKAAGVAEGRAGYSTEEEQALLQIFRSLTADERGVVVRMLSGLSAA